MYPEYYFLGFPIKLYGLFVMIGFLSAVWMAMNRAQRVKADPDVVLNLSLICLISGVIGSRLIYVIHYWPTQFAHLENPIWSAIDIRQGGLEFIGAPILAGICSAIYMWWAKLSTRMYLDILTPGLMWGLAFGRIGCFFNGCCFGGVCENHTVNPPQPAYVWAMQFPFGSSPQISQWENRKVTVPAELLVTGNDPMGAPSLLPQQALRMPYDLQQRPMVAARDAAFALEQAKKQKLPQETIDELTQKAEAATRTAMAHQNATLLALVENNTRLPSRITPERRISSSELLELSNQFSSRYTHPTQLYAAVNALLLSFLLIAIFYARRRHGVVFCWMLLLYPISRLVEEMIRVDNPHDSAGLTISQFISLCVLLFGCLLMFIIYHLPERSPLAIPWVPPVDPKAESTAQQA